MKILHLTFSMQIGGIETMLVNIVNEQAKKHEVTLMFFNDDFNVDILNKVNTNVNVINIGRKLHTKNIYDVIKLNYKILSFSPDIIHLHHPSLIRLLQRFLLRGNIVLTMHDIPQKKDYLYLPKYKNICAISKSVQEALLNSGFKSRLIENGIDFDSFSKKDNYCSTIFHIVQVSRLMLEKKGQDITIKTINKLRNRGIKNIHVDIIGEGPDEEKLKEMVCQLNLENFVSLLGPRSQEWLHQHYKDYSLFIQPSRYEGFGLTVVEALAAKVPVLVSDQDGPKEIIDGGKYGFLFKTESVHDCANKILSIMNFTDIQIFSQNAFLHAKKCYNVQSTAEKYIKFYKEVNNK